MPRSLGCMYDEMSETSTRTYLKLMRIGDVRACSLRRLGGRPFFAS